MNRIVLILIEIAIILGINVTDKPRPSKDINEINATEVFIRDLTK